MRKDKLFLSVFPLVIVVLLYLVSCATPPPTKEIGDAESAVAAAKAEGAPDCAPDEFAAAQSDLSKGKALASEFCHELEARRLLIDAKAKADEARFKCLASKKAPAPAPVPPPPPPTVEEFGLKDIFFDFDKSKIRSDAEPVLQEDADMLKKNTNVTVVIEGYADIRGTSAYNLRLAQRRANSTKAYLVKLGIDPSRIQAVSKGKTQKFAAGKTEEAFQLNRRSHFIPTKPGATPGARIFFKFNEESKPAL
jgi:peptidoglycan-associated lipoprotein